jgi:methylated-DNA-[protein]-cysteine S-methyltransferase
MSTGTAAVDGDRMGVMTDSPLYRGCIDSPVGPLELLATDSALCALLFGDEPADRVRAGSAHGVVVNDESHPIVKTAIAQLGEYFAGVRRAFDLPLEPRGTAFQQQAWSALRTIPFGATVSYGEQARQLGDARKARAVGAANGKNPISIIVPCHRVIGADGSMTGFAAGVELKTWLLDHERQVLARS